MLYQLNCTRDPETAEMSLDGGIDQLGGKLEMWSDAQQEWPSSLLSRTNLAAGCKAKWTMLSTQKGTLN